jgi:ubiquinone/menaquinone biosynthesis C-methylase UbiE
VYIIYTLQGGKKMTDIIMMKADRGYVCPHQIGFILDNPFRRLIQNPKKIIGEYIREGNTVIDMGCGPGYFTIDMAKMVGKNGSVVAVDLQEHMLLKVIRKAAKHGVSDRMEFHQCESNKIGLNRKADFILAFYMIHETPNPKMILAELKDMLKNNGKLLIVEPKMHVSKNLFDKMLSEAQDVGLRVLDLPKGKGGRSVLFTRKR